MGYKLKKHLQQIIRKRAGIHQAPETTLYLNRNERTIPFDPQTKKLLLERLSKINLNLYPDMEKIYQKLAQWLNLSAEEIFITEGVSGAVKALLETIPDQKNNIVFPFPTFALYPVYCDMFQLEHRKIGYINDYQLDVAGLLKAIDQETAIVFLPNPNVPIEGTLGLEQVEKIAKHCAEQNALLVLDEVYYPYGGPTAIEFIKKYDNVLVMRSFSKAFGLAGIRVGYLAGNKKIIDYISKMRTGYETNSVSAEIAAFFIDNFSVVENYIKQVKEGLAYLKAQFDELGLEYNGGNASNFIYLNLKSKSLTQKIVQELKEKDILVRGPWPTPFDQGFSISAGPKEQMVKLIEEFKVLWRKHG